MLFIHLRPSSQAFQFEWNCNIVSLHANYNWNLLRYLSVSLCSIQTKSFNRCIECFIDDYHTLALDYRFFSPSPVPSDQYAWLRKIIINNNKVHNLVSAARKFNICLSHWSLLFQNSHSKILRCVRKKFKIQMMFAVMRVQTQKINLNSMLCWINRPFFGH